MKYSIMVKPGSSQEKVEARENELLVFTHARAHDGEANKRVVEILADYFDVSKSQIEIASGQKSKKKTIEVIK